LSGIVYDVYTLNRHRCSCAYHCDMFMKFILYTSNLSKFVTLKYHVLYIKISRGIMVVVGFKDLTFYVISYIM